MELRRLCDVHSSETYFIQTIHFFKQIAGLQLREVRNLPDGSLDMTELREKIRPSKPCDYESYTSLVCIENTHNYLGGVVLPLEWLDQVNNENKL